MPDFVIKKTSDLVSGAGIDDPKERRKYSRRLSDLLRRLLRKDRKDWPPCIADISRDGREYVVYFRFEEPQAGRKRKTVMDMVLSNYDPSKS